MRNQSARRDRLLARIAAGQHGAICFEQLLGAGLTKSAVLRRARSGRLHRVHRGVYAVGHAGLSKEGQWMAAVLACGASAVLSHRAAAALWGLLPSDEGVVDVTVPGDAGRRRRRGIRLHRSSSLRSVHVTRRLNIPVTKPARTIADLRRVTSPDVVRRALRAAIVVGLDIPEDVEADFTRSELEGRFLTLCRHHRLPRPEVNVRVGSSTVDFLWRGQQLIVETDGYRYHRGRQAFEDDRARDVDLRLRGYEVARFSYRQVTEQPARVAAVLRALLT